MSFRCTDVWYMCQLIRTIDILSSYEGSGVRGNVQYTRKCFVRYTKQAFGCFVYRTFCPVYKILVDQRSGKRHKVLAVSYIGRPSVQSMCGIRNGQKLRFRRHIILIDAVMTLMPAILAGIQIPVYKTCPIYRTCLVYQPFCLVYGIPVYKTLG